MSRIADALRRAEDPNLASDPEPVRSVVSSEGRDFTFVPWDLGGSGEASFALPSARPAARMPSTEHTERAHGAGRQVGSTEYADLVQRLFRPGAGEPTARSVLFIDLDPGSGGAHVAADVARVLAGQDAGSVCAVDVSFGAAALHEEFQVAEGPGFCDALLSGYAAASVAVDAGKELWVVPAGGTMSDQADWVPTTATRTLRQVASRFGFVIGSASVRGTSVTTLVALALGSDGVVLVLDGSRTRRDEAAGLLDRMREAGVVVFGAVLKERKSAVLGADWGVRERR